MTWRRGELFADRAAAGRVLAERLSREPSVTALAPDTVPQRVAVLGLARGGVPVARPVADALGAPLDALVVRKIGAPGQPEFAMGAIAAGEIIVNDDIPRRLGVSDKDFQAIVDRENEIRMEREARYRAGRPAIALGGRLAILVDDGLATGSTMAVAIRAVRAAGAGSVIVAAPTAPSDVLARFRSDPAVTAVVVVSTPEPFHAVGQSYEDFRQVDDDEVRRCLGST
ncbi:phosphoribosyltransferase family protein [Gordonia sp. CPCC 206044]|uniref:phosphoribosyltransferase n=1 Tax=Gordonia sp. CPCC 206044 TaxID=3140793 RepID=UPI003AF3EBD9